MRQLAQRLVVLGFGITLAWSAQGVDAVAELLTVDVAPTADAFVSAADPGGNFGAAGALALAASGLAKGEFQSVLQFDTSSAKNGFDLTFGAGQWSVEEVTLALTAAFPGNPIFNSQSSGQFSVSWMQNDSWLEGTGKPRLPTTDGIAFDTLASFLGAGDRGLGTFGFDGSTDGKDVYSLIPEADFLADVAAGHPVSLRLFAADPGIAYVCNARDYTTAEYRPTLSITAVPEPGSMALFLTGVCTLFWLGRRRQQRSTTRRMGRATVGAVLAGLVACASTFAAEPATVRVAVIGGIVETGFWEALSERFEESTGHKVEVVASGTKSQIAEVFREGKADLITMHASDTIINLVADGYASNPQPWLKNDLLIVGPEADPAGVRGMNDAPAAMKKIVDSRSPFVVHSSLGAQEVLRDVLDAADVSLSPDTTTVMLSQQSRQVLRTAAAKSAYTLVGRIPFRSGKLPNSGLVPMVQGDPRLRRPYVVTVADRRRLPEARVEAAARLAEFLRSQKTQGWIADYGRGQLDDQPLFFRVVGQGEKSP